MAMDPVDAVPMKTTFHSPGISRAVTTLRQPDQAASAFPISWTRVMGALRQRLARPAHRLDSIGLCDNETTKLAPGRAGSSIEVRRGVVWLTGSASEGDIILHEGDQYTLRRRTAYVAQAIGDTDAVLSMAY